MVSTTLKWVDFHTHILDSSNVEGIIGKSKKERVLRWLVNSVDLKNWKSGIQKASQNPLALVGIGWHPEQVLEVNENKIEKILEEYQPFLEDCLFFGETGLDFKYGKTSEQQSVQRKVFGQFIDWSREYNKLIQVHSRQAKQESLDLLEEKNVKKVILHWFNGNKKQQELIIEKKWVCTVGPAILNSPHVDEFIQNQPLDLLGLETDSPIPFDGKTSDPSWIPLVAQRVAEIKKVSVEEVNDSQQTLFCRFFPAIPINPWED